MSIQLKEMLQSVEITEPQQAGSLQIFGLRWPSPKNGVTYTTLDEALATDALDVAEVSEVGSVPTLKVTNKGDVMVFLMAGEQLIGAKQNRVLNTSIMVGSRTQLPIPVSCVEAGRWGYRSAKFGSSGTMSHGLLRKKMTRQAHEGYRSAGMPTSKQGEVWSEVDRKLASMKSVSPSHALEQTYEDHKLRLSDLLGQLRVPTNACGAAFVQGGKIVGVDLFDRPATLAKLWPKLVCSFALDGLEESMAPAQPVEAATVRAWLLSAAGAKAEPFQSPGVGQDVRLQGSGVIGAGLVVEDQPVHVELFPGD